MDSASNTSGVGRRQLPKTVLSGAILGATTQAGIDLAPLKSFMPKPECKMGTF